MFHAMKEIMNDDKITRLEGDKVAVSPEAMQEIAARQDKALSGDLPELPEPAHRGPSCTGSYFDAYTAAQMREYARAAVAASPQLPVAQMGGEWIVTHNGRSVAATTLFKAMTAARELRTEDEKQTAAKNLMTALAEEEKNLLDPDVQIKALEKRIEVLNACETAAIRDRDCYHEWADDLAAAISKFTGVDIGEHSNMNNPWREALDAIENYEPAASHPSNAAGQDAPAAWVHEEDPSRVISAAQKQQALRDGGASASSVKPYSIAAVVPAATVPQVVQAPIDLPEMPIPCFVGGAFGEGQMRSYARKAIALNAAPIVATVPSEPIKVIALSKADGEYVLKQHGYASYTLTVIAKDGSINKGDLFYAAPSHTEQASDVRNAAIDVLRLSTHCLHVMPDGDCKCSQCDFVRARDALLSATPADKGNAPEEGIEQPTKGENK